jgi:hypothetical protein
MPSGLKYPLAEFIILLYCVMNRCSYAPSAPVSVTTAAPGA